MSSQVWAEVLTIGSELVLGQLVDTNAAFIAQALSEIGVGLACHTTVGDDRARMDAALRSALDRSQIVITTGGLGPTEDDLTRESAAAVLGRELEFRPELLAHIEGLFKRIGYRMPPNNKRQAYIPQGAEVVHNPRGTAPCFRYEYEDRVLICLPGVPQETEPLIRDEIIPYLKQKYTPGGTIWMNRVLKVGGLGESGVDAQIKDLIRSSKNPIIGLQASPGEIKVRLTAMADSETEAGAILDEMEAKIRDILGPLIFGMGDESLAGNTAALLAERGLSLTVVEALTRGSVAAELGRNLPSEHFFSGLILDRPSPAVELCSLGLEMFPADIVLAVAGFPQDDGQVKVEILARKAVGPERERVLSLGGPARILQQRAATMTMFTLLQLLRE